MSLTKVTYSMIKGAPVNVQDFGATGDGVTDDTVAIQSALNYAATLYGTTVVFPHGDYLCSGPLIIPAPGIGLTLQGDGRENTGQSSTKIIYSGAGPSFLSTPVANSRFITLDNISFQATNVAFTGRLVQLSVFNLTISRCNFSAGPTIPAFALLDLSYSVGANITTSYFRGGQRCIYGIGMTTILFSECNFGQHTTYGADLNGSQGVTFQSCALQETLSQQESNFIRALDMQALTVTGCWAGDLVTTATSPASYHITFSGDGLNVSGNYINGDGFNKTTAILIAGATQGVTVQSNYFSNFTACLNLGAGLAKHVVFLSNRIRLCNAVVTGTVASGGNAIVQKFLFGEAGPDLNVTGSLLLSAGSGIQFGSGLLMDTYEEGTFSPADVSGSGLAFTNVAGNYIKIGRVVVCNVQFQYPVTAAAVQARISLPFAVATAPVSSSGVFSVNTSGASATAIPSPTAGQSYILLSNSGAGTAYTNSNASGGYFRGTVTYFAAS